MASQGKAKSMLNKFQNLEKEEANKKSVKPADDKASPAVANAVPEATSKPGQTRGKGILHRKEDPKDKKIVKAAESAVPEPAKLQEDETSVEVPRLKNVRGYWANYKEETKVERKPDKIEKDSDRVENDPQNRDDVVKADDEESRTLVIERGRTRNMASRFLQQEETREKPVFKMDLDPNAKILENDPEVRDGVVKGEYQTEQVVASERGRIRNMATRFLTQEEEEYKPRTPIQLDLSSEPTVIENEPAAQREDIVKSKYEAVEVIRDRGAIKNIANRFKDYAEEDAQIKTSTSNVRGKPKWVEEIENATEVLVVENEPQVRTDVAREQDKQNQIKYVNTARSEQDTKETKEEKAKADAKAKQAQVTKQPEPAPGRRGAPQKGAAVPEPKQTQEKALPPEIEGNKKVALSPANRKAPPGKLGQFSGKKQPSKKEATPPPEEEEPKAPPAVKKKPGKEEVVMIPNQRVVLKRIGKPK